VYKYFINIYIYFLVIYQRGAVAMDTKHNHILTQFCINRLCFHDDMSDKLLIGEKRELGGSALLI
jgi:hypothetical protein